MLEVVELELVPGLVVNGKYRLERQIGRGGFGVVWAAIDIASGEPRALKCLTSEGASDAKHQERLRREARAMTSLTHPHIARVFGVEELPAGTPFIVMELLQGRTLHAQLARGPLSVAQARGILIQISDALRTVHARGIIHRDLKPANVMIIDDRFAKVLDFGIAKELSSGDKHKLTTTGTALGTLYYMAPEQIFGERNLEGRCDVWALGILAHECLTLRRPTDADGDNSGQVLKAILECNFPRLKAMVPDCPADIDDLVARMLTREVAKRPTSEEIFETLVRPAMSPTKPHSLGRTNQMLETLPLSDAPMFALTVRDHMPSTRMPSTAIPSTVVPSTVVPSTVVPSTVLASTAVPSTVIPSTVVPPTVLAMQSPGTARPVPNASAVAVTLGSAQAPAQAPATPAAAHAVPQAGAQPGSQRSPHFAAPAMTPPGRPAEDPTFQLRGAQPKSRSTLVAIAVFVTITLLGTSLVIFMTSRARHAQAAGAASASASALTVQTVPSASASVTPPPPPASSPAASASPPSPPASVASAPSAGPSVTAAHRPSAPSGRTTAPATSKPSGAPTKKDDPPISDQRF